MTGVCPYRKAQKNDDRDAEAIVEGSDAPKDAFRSRSILPQLPRSFANEDPGGAGAQAGDGQLEERKKIVLDRLSKRAWSSVHAQDR